MWIPISVGAVALIMMLIERSRPGRDWPKVAGWWFRALFLNGCQVLMTLLGTSSWDRILQDRRPWSAESLGTFPSVLLGYLALTFVYYWWHRWRHEVPFLWRSLHQIHHSPKRLEIITSFYKHPLEIFVNALISSFILYFLVGLAPVTAAWVVMITGLAELFYHWNVATPHWLGFLFQRPESHCWHHRQDHHSGNYSDLPLWDMLFGTFHNPKTQSFTCGFEKNRERALIPMLLGRDLHKEGSP